MRVCRVKLLHVCAYGVKTAPVATGIFTFMKGGCWGGVGGGGMITFFALAHMVDATSLTLVVALAHMVDATSLTLVVALAHMVDATSLT